MTGGADVEERLAALERRLHRLEDERAVARLISAYGTSADGGAEDVADPREPDGAYDADESPASGRRHIETGREHVLGPPHVTVDGDEAVASSRSLMIVHDGSGYVIRRITVDHWKLRRGPSGWRITSRTSLDGPQQPRGGGDNPSRGGEGSPADRIEVLDTLYRLQEAIDGRDWDTIRATFTPGGSGYGRTGVDNVIARMRDHLGGCGATQHLLGNVRVTVAGDTAQSVACARVYHMGAGDKAGEFFECMGEYKDRWVRTEDGWRLASRDFGMRIRLGDFGVLRPG